jgi:hypothetical protein
MSDPTPSSPPARVRRVAPRRKKASRAERVFTSLRAGMAVWDIARRENCSVRTVRRIVAESLARLEIDPTAGYAQLQIARLNDAMLVAHDKMLGGDLQALDRVLKVLESQDRYHGFGTTLGAAPVDADRARLTPPTRPRRLARPAAVRALAAPALPETLALAPPDLRQEMVSPRAEITDADKIRVATS